jgi:hypothetical protein
VLLERAKALAHGVAAPTSPRLKSHRSRRSTREIPVGYATTDDAGRFAFLGVTPGSYTVRAYCLQPAGPAFRFAPPAAGAPPITEVERVAPGAAESPLFAETEVSVGASHVDDLSLALRPGASASGP